MWSVRRVCHLPNAKEKMFILDFIYCVCSTFVNVGGQPITPSEISIILHDYTRAEFNNCFIIHSK